ncbi:SDR family oxidoreductase [Bacillus sp. JCM 19041]|uniref:SDR family oxidoreductase n=1 Tax=Bacillus sp. JCM 19041 TaxID=1460637 RepID=UPI0006D2814B
MELGLTGKNILVTGAAKGVGKALALAAAKAGANIALHYHNSEEEALQTVNEINETGVSVCMAKADLARLEEIKKMKQTINNELGTVDMVVNNAGFTQMKSFFQYKPGEWKREIDVCFYGAINLAHTFMPTMMEQKQGKFIHIIGDSARTGDRNLIVSAAARSGTIGFMKSLAQEVGRKNVQCNTVSLGLIDQGNLTFNEETRSKILKQYPLKRLGDAADVVGAVLFLLSDSSNWITGQVLAVNGGHSMIG